MFKKDFSLIKGRIMNVVRISFLVSVLLIAGVFTCFGQEYTLEIKSKQEGSNSLPARVRVNPPGVTYECPFAATLTFGAWTEVTLTANSLNMYIMCGAGEGVVQYKFLRWEGDWPNDPQSLTGTIVMDSNKSITAVYEYIPRICPSYPPTPAPPRLGDVNGDGRINIIDALLVAQFYVGLPVDNVNEERADVNCDGVVDITDALLIAQYYVGIIDSFC